MTQQAKFLSYIMDVCSISDTAVETFDKSIQMATDDGRDYIHVPIEAAAAVSSMLTILTGIAKGLALESADLEDGVAKLVSKLNGGSNG